MAELLFRNLEQYLITRARAWLDGRPEPFTDQVEVDRVEWDELPQRLVVIRDDSGPDESIVTAVRQIGVTVLAGTRQRPDDAIDLADLLGAFIRGLPGAEPGNPVADVRGLNGAYLVPEEAERARAYLTAELVVVGEILTSPDTPGNDNPEGAQS